MEDPALEKKEMRGSQRDEEQILSRGRMIERGHKFSRPK